MELHVVANNAELNECVMANFFNIYQFMLAKKNGLIK